MRSLTIRNIYDFSDYKDFLNHTLKQMGKGSRLQLARAAGCQPGYVSHVLGGHSHFSAEQLEQIAEHLRLGTDEKKFLITMLMHNRAGTAALKKMFHNELQSLREKNTELKHRLGVKEELGAEAQAIFYSSWHYGALHVAVSIPGCDSEKGMSERFRIPIERVHEVVGFLEQVGLIKRVGGRLQIGHQRIFLGSESPLISKFHSNWRLRSIASMDQYKKSDLHYSSVMTCGRADVEKIREIFVRAIEEARAIIKSSKDESCYSYAVDLFEL